MTEAYAGIVPGLPKTYPGGTVSIVLTVGSAASTVLLSHGAVGKAAILRVLVRHTLAALF